MVKNLRPLIDKVSAIDFLNAVRNGAGWDYQSRIPEATQANISQTIDQIWEASATRNQVADALVNRIGLVKFNNVQWQNPLAEFKMGKLTQGETIEEVQVGLLNAIDYDFDRDELEKEIFGNHPIEVQSRFHKRNRQDRYVVTVNMIGLRLALLNDELGSFVSQVMGAANVSDQNDEFLLMANLFREVDRSFDGNLHTVNVDDIGDPGSTPEQSRYMLRRLREYSDTLPFISRLYNPAGMPVGVPANQLMLILTPAANAAMDVEALAAAFQLDKAEFAQRKVIIPEQYLGIPGTQAILTTKQFFVVADTLVETTQQFNPAKLSTNYWLHHHQVMSASPFAPFVLFNSRRESTVIPETDYKVTDIGAFTIKDQTGTVAATQLTRGVLYDVAVEAVTTPTGGPNDALEITISGQTSQFTYATNHGSLYIGPDEDAESITITATAVDGSYSESTTRAIIGTQIVFQPPTVLPDADSDALEEVTPEPLTVDENDDVTIPSVVGVQYRKAGVDVANGTVHHLTASTVFTAVARPGKELAPGAVASWTLAP